MAERETVDSNFCRQHVDWVNVRDNILSIKTQRPQPGLKLVISIKSLASSGHLCLLRRVFYTAVRLTVIGKY